MNEPHTHSDMMIVASPPGGAAAAGEVTQNALRAAALAFGVLSIATVGLAIGLGNGVRGTDVSMLTIALLTFVVGCVPLVLDQARVPERRHVILSFVSLVFMAHFVVPALMLYLPATGPIDASSTSNTNLLPEHVVDGQWLALLGLVALYAGYSLPLGKLLARPIPTRRYDWNAPTVLLVAIVFLALGWVVTLFGLLGLIPDAVGTGFIGVFATGRNYANVLLAYAYLQHRSKLAGLLILLNVPLLLLFGVLTSDKQDALIGPALIVLTAMLLNNRIRARWIVAGLLAVTILYPASGFVRKGLMPYSSPAELVLNPGYTLGAISAYVGSGDARQHMVEGFEATSHRIDGLGIASVIIRDTPSASPFQNGRTLGLFFVSFIPRALWEEKPNINIGQWITDVYGSGPHIDARTAPTQIGEYYLNFGVPGIVFGLMLLGTVLRLTHEAFGRRAATAPTILAQTVIVLTLCLHFAGSVAGVYGQVVFTLVPLALLHAAIRMFLPVTRVDEGASETNAITASARGT